MTAYPDTLLLINGTWRHAKDKLRFTVSLPRSEEVIRHVAHPARADLDAALAAAKRGFAVSSATPAYDRAALMRKASDILRAGMQLIIHMIWRCRKRLSAAWAIAATARKAH